MDRIWRFFDGQVGGVVVADTRQQATERVLTYLNGHFGDDPVDADTIEIWPCPMDDDYDERFPWALAVYY